MAGRLGTLAAHVTGCATAQQQQEEEVVPLDTTDDGLEIVGGKGRSLSRMSNSGLHVPTGFIVTTASYRSFVAENGMAEELLRLATPEVVDGMLSFELPARRIRERFEVSAMSAGTVAEIRAALAALGGTELPLAVRSSANAEDLPGLSFAGQHSSFLNVIGGDAIAAAVKDCWASLWTAQAMAYRHENDVDHAAVAMGVVVQQMVHSDVSGIMFTANPATGDRSEMIINASFGLGEAVVSGQVTPDTYLINRDTDEITTTIGAKEQQIVADNNDGGAAGGGGAASGSGGGVRLEDIEEEKRGASSLDDAQIKELVASAKAIEAIFETGPQDIEWGYSNGVLYLLQSRPITNLVPPPLNADDLDWTPAYPAKLAYRRQIVENMPDPLSPLYEELSLTDGQQEGRRRDNVRRALQNGTATPKWRDMMDGGCASGGKQRNGPCFWWFSDTILQAYVCPEPVLTKHLSVVVVVYLLSALQASTTLL